MVPQSLLRSRTFGHHEVPQKCVTSYFVLQFVVEGFNLEKIFGKASLYLTVENRFALFLSSLLQSRPFADNMAPYLKYLINDDLDIKSKSSFKVTFLHSSRFFRISYNATKRLISLFFCFR